LLHSGSKKANIRIVQDAQQVTLEISDEGRGLAPGTLDQSHPGLTRLGVGIAGMRERVRQLHGRVEISSNCRGTLVKAILPLGGESSPYIGSSWRMSMKWCDTVCASRRHAARVRNAVATLQTAGKPW